MKLEQIDRGIEDDGGYPTARRAVGIGQAILDRTVVCAKCGGLATHVTQRRRSGGWQTTAALCSICWRATETDRLWESIKAKKVALIGR